MAKVGFESDIKFVSGRLEKHGKPVYNYCKKTGKTYRSNYREHEDANSSGQQQVRAIFKARQTAASTWYAANKPSSTNPNGTADFIKVKAAYDAQNKYGNIFCFIRSLVCGTTPAVAVPGSTTTTGGGSTTQGGGLTD